MPKVEIYTWRFCPFCIRAKQLLDRKGVAYEEYVIDGDEDARDAMVARGSDGRRSVPQVFIDDAHVGGATTSTPWSARAGWRRCWPAPPKPLPRVGTMARWGSWNLGSPMLVSSLMGFPVQTQAPPARAAAGP